MIHMKNQPQPLVSVIIPTYNSATTLEACLRSINAETYKNHLVSLRSLEAFEAQLQNIEIIVVDKFSADLDKTFLIEILSQMFLKIR